MSRQFKVFCGTPEAHCSGSHTDFSEHYRGTRKTHSSRAEAKNCYRKYLIHVKNYTQVSKNEFRDPESGRVVVLAKESKFGSIARKGKESRYMPDRGDGRITTS